MSHCRKLKDWSGVEWSEIDGLCLGKISEAEFVAGGMEGLPSFEGYKDLGRESIVIYRID